MSTRATIEFRSGKETIYIYRHHDGFPDTILSDINYTIEKKKDSWSDPELGLLVSAFLGMHFDELSRVPDYMIQSGFAGDESYRYFVMWNGKEWNVTYE